MKLNLKPLLSSCVIALTMVAAGCDNSPVHKPSKLPKLAHVQTIKQVFSASVGASEKYDPLRLQMDTINGATYAVSHDGYVVAYAADGKRLWEKRPSKKENDITSGVTAANGLVVVGSGKGVLYAMDATTGELKWQRQLSASILTPSLVHDNRVVTLTNDGTAYGTDLSTGQPVWSFDVSSAQLRVRGYAAPVMADDNNTVLVASSSAFVYGLDVNTGLPKWQRRVAVSEGRSDVDRLVDIGGDPVVYNNQLFTVSYQGQLTVVDLSNQRVLWSQDCSSLRTLAVSNGLVYVATTDGKVKAFSQSTGEPAWSQESLAYRNLSNPVVLGQYLVVGDAEGVLHLLDPNTGTVLGRVQAKGAVQSLRVIDGRLYVQTSTGHLSIWQAS